MDIFNRHTETRGAPRLSDPVAAVGAAAAGVGVLLISVDVFADNPGRGAPVALFGALVLAGYLTLLLAPRSLHPAGITAVVVGIIGALGWWWLPGAHSMADIRPFIILTIVAMSVCFVVPKSRGRAIFIAIVLIALWLWALGEIASPEQSYSLAPIPSPPPHTIMSLTAFAGQVSIFDLDETDPLYPLARDCNDGDMAACDSLYARARFGSDFSEFAASCGNSFTATPGFCAGGPTDSSFDFGDQPPIPLTPNITGPGFRLSGGDDKSFELGLVSTIFGLLYLGALYVLDRRRIRGLATAFVIPATLALVEGVGLLGNAAGHAWVGGLLTMMAGVLIGVVGHVGRDRRFTTWIGGILVGIGAVTIALDAVDLSSSNGDGEVKLAGPGLIVIASGVALVLFAFIVARVLVDPDPDPAPDPGGPEPSGPDPVGGYPPPGQPATVAAEVPVSPPPPDYGWGPPPAAPLSPSESTTDWQPPRP